MNKTRRVFIFAHCDDELFCLPLLLEKNSENTLIFLTSSDRNNANAPKVRQEEALKASEYLNSITTIKTLFYKAEIYDGTVHDDLNDFDLCELSKIVREENPDELVTLSYEAGHQDHDTAYLITHLIARDQSLVLRCFSGYRGSILFPRFFTALKPAHKFKRVKFNRILTVLSALQLMMIYRSQVKTWIGLAPVLLVKYAFFPLWESRNEVLLLASPNGVCFYENRGRAKQSEVIRSHQRLITHFNSKNL